MSRNIITAGKLGPEGKLYWCSLDDPEATQFYVLGSGDHYKLRCDVRGQAECFAAALEHEFEAGRQAAFAELRTLIGAK